MAYDLAARRRLGRAVRDARLQKGFTKRTEFADKVGRSARQVQALENGEDGVGPDTINAVARALDWPIERMYQLLDDEGPQFRSAPTTLTSVSSEELAAEALRRMKAGDGVVDRDSASMRKTGSAPRVDISTSDLVRLLQVQLDDELRRMNTAKRDRDRQEASELVDALRATLEAFQARSSASREGRP